MSDALTPIPVDPQTVRDGYQLIAAVVQSVVVVSGAIAVVWKLSNLSGTWGRWVGEIEVKLDSVIKAVAGWAEKNGSDHQRIETKLDEHGERIARVEEKVSK